MSSLSPEKGENTRLVSINPFSIYKDHFNVLRAAHFEHFSLHIFAVKYIKANYFANLLFQPLFRRTKESV